MLFWSIRSVVLSAKDNKIRKAGEELVGRPWLTGAIEEDLGTCWIGAFTEDLVKGF